jgi:serine/threonine protein kinase
MWALGILLFAMLAGQFPFRGQSESELYNKIQRAQIKWPETISREAKQIITKLVEPNTHKRYTAANLMNENWIRCNDLTLSIFETAGTLFRTTSMDGRLSQTTSSLQAGNAGEGRKSSKADGFNMNIQKVHVNAIDHLKSLGFSNRAIEDSLKTENQGNKIQNNQIYSAYKDTVEKRMQSLADQESF